MRKFQCFAIILLLAMAFLSQTPCAWAEPVLSNSEKLIGEERVDKLQGLGDVLRGVNYTVTYGTITRNGSDPAVSTISPSPDAGFFTVSAGNEVTLTIVAENGYALYEGAFDSSVYTITRNFDPATVPAGWNTTYTIKFTPTGSMTLPEIRFIIGDTTWYSRYIGGLRYKNYEAQNQHVYLIQGGAHPDLSAEIVNLIHFSTNPDAIPAELDKYYLTRTGNTLTSLYTGLRDGTKIVNVYFDVGEDVSLHGMKLYPLWQPNDGSSPKQIVTGSSVAEAIFASAKVDTYSLVPEFTFYYAGTEGEDYFHKQGTMVVGVATIFEILPQLQIEEQEVFYWHDFTEGPLDTAGLPYPTTSAVRFYDSVANAYTAKAEASGKNYTNNGTVTVGTPSVPSLSQTGSVTQEATIQYIPEVLASLYSGDTRHSSASGTETVNVVQRATIATAVGSTEKPGDVYSAAGTTINVMDGVKGWFTDYNTTTPTDLTGDVQWNVLAQGGSLTINTDGTVTGGSNSWIKVEYTLTEDSHVYENGDNVAIPVIRYFYWDKTVEAIVSKDFRDASGVSITSPAADFEFVLSVTDEDDSPLAAGTVISTSAGTLTLDSAGSARFSLKNGESLTLRGLGIKWKMRLVEQPCSFTCTTSIQETATGKNWTGTDTGVVALSAFAEQSGNFTFKNVLATGISLGNVTIEKQIDNNTNIPDGTCTFALMRIDTYENIACAITDVTEGKVTTAKWYEADEFGGVTNIPWDPATYEWVVGAKYEICEAESGLGVFNIDTVNSTYTATPGESITVTDGFGGEYPFASYFFTLEEECNGFDLKFTFVNKRDVQEVTAEKKVVRIVDGNEVDVTDKYAGTSFGYSYHRYYSVNIYDSLSNVGNNNPLARITKPLGTPISFGNLPMGGVYYVKEVSCPIGTELLRIEGNNEFVTPEKVDGYDGLWAFTPEYEGDGIVVVNQVTQDGRFGIAKLVEGNAADRYRKFKFTVTITDIDGTPLPMGTEISYDKGTTPNAGTLTLDATGSATIELAHGESIILTGMDGLWLAKATEEDVSGEGYNTSWRVGNIPSGEGIGSRANATFPGRESDFIQPGAGKIVTMINKRNLTVPTGILMDIWPYALAVLLALGGGIALLAGRRRRKNRDKNNDEWK